MITENMRTQDKVEIQQLITEQQSAICTKDLDGIMAFYASEVILFDLKPPFQTKGKDAIYRLWEVCLPCFPDSFEMETRDLNIIVNGDLAFAHWLLHFTGTEKDHPAMQMWMRTTAVYQKNYGKWQIVHEHVSVPFNPETSEAVLTLDPSLDS
ncbi:MAG: SgcJ/EcaC family oxidoreductase [Scytonematopsis contorta HA4267-MV1]|jgi:uncharacterized protein (TIGR02246 family)|nr:SgcJ/EcaC family oxidoreductase [Scytonematopsis contorta HA4267-MV1]